MKQCSGADAPALLLKSGASSELRFLQVLDAGDVLVAERGVGQWPEVFNWLQFGRMGRQKEQVHVVRQVQVLTGVPTGSVQDQQADLADPGPIPPGAQTRLAPLQTQERRL